MKQHRPSLVLPVRAGLRFPLLRRLARDTRGASMIEYALMLFLVLVVAAVAVNTLGKTTRSGMDHATIAF